MIIKTPKKPLNINMTPAGSKSFTNRALIIAALTKGTSVISNASPSNDTKLLINALKNLGCKIIQNKMEIKITGGIKPNKKVTINAHDAGTTFRFLTALCSLTENEIVLTGSKRMQQRPVGELVTALNKLGANISYINKEGYPPLKIKKGNLKGGAATVDGGISSQFISAILMLGPVLENGLKLKIKGRQVSSSYIDMTREVMKHFQRPDGSYKPSKYTSEADLSGASYFWAMGALNPGGRARINNVNINSAQGDLKFADALSKMGASVVKNKKQNWIEVSNKGPLKAIKIDMKLMPDTAQTLAVTAAFAKGKTKITGLSTLRMKETDRLSALKTELAKMGIKTKTGKDFIEIYGGEPKSAKIKTYNDHRMAMSFATAAARVNMEIENPDTVKKSFPDFWQKMKAAGFKLK